jgi:hypothetical protein
MKSSQVPFLPGIGAVFVSAITFSLYGQFALAFEADLSKSTR